MDDKIEVTGYKSYYAVIDRGDGARCAWCDKLMSEFDYPDDHLITEDTLAKIEEGFGNSEELLYGKFKKIKEELLKDA